MYNPRYFKDDEFKRVACSVTDCNPDSLRRLDRAREIAGVPFVLTSAYRSKASEIEKGRSGNSAHTLGRAFDVRCCSSVDRYKIVYGAIAAGFPRIGIASTFIHMDDSNLTPPCIWLY